VVEPAEGQELGALELKAVMKSFGATQVLHGIDLAVGDGEFVVFVGPSGCGKSTLLRIIAGLEEASAGDVLIEGENVNLRPPAARGIAMVFQTYALYPHLTARDNMALGLKQARRPVDEINRRIAAASTMLPLGDYLARRPAELSGGQRQRVAIGRAIVREPKLFLFDEPLSNLDAALRVNTRIEIARLHHELKATMVYVTHDQVEAMTLADRIVVMNQSRIEQIGTPMELYDRPGNIFVAGFIGSPRMNFIPASSLGVAHAETIGVRPEHIVVSAKGGDWKGVAVHVERLGPDTNVYLDTEFAGTLTARLFGEVDFEAGATHYASAEPRRLYRFDGSGRAIA
jgi:multiple sugar transport system ATP-binding protein